MRKGLLHGIGLACIVVFLTVSFAGTAEEEHPFFPSLVNTPAGEPIPIASFKPVGTCKECHSEIYGQWKGSMHSLAYKDPVWQALWKLGDKETDGLTHKLCLGCHSTAGVVSEEVYSKDGKKVPELVEDGVQCHVCHSVSGTRTELTPTGEPENASFMISPGNVHFGPFKDAKSTAHETAYSELHTKSEFCANCHQVFHPLNDMPIERTYDEWKNSIYAQKGIQCQDCHMQPIENAIEVARTLRKPKNPGWAAKGAPKRPHIYTHEFIGGNFTVTGLMGAAKHADLAKQRLRSAATVDVLAPQHVIPGSIGNFSVKVTNVGAGHDLPTSLTEVRQMWLDIKVTDSAGRVLLTSGDISAKGDIDPSAVMYHAVAADSEGNPTLKPWEMVYFLYKKTIPAKGYSVERYSFLAPADAKGNVVITATLRYRSFPQSLANLLLGDSAPMLPVVDMATGTSVVPVK